MNNRGYEFKSTFRERMRIKKRQKLEKNCTRIFLMAICLCLCLLMLGQLQKINEKAWYLFVIALVLVVVDIGKTCIDYIK